MTETDTMPQQASVFDMSTRCLLHMRKICRANSTPTMMGLKLFCSKVTSSDANAEFQAVIVLYIRNRS